MLLVDTNVLVYAANVEADEHEACRSLLETWRAEPLPWYSTWPILHEFLRVVTHPRVLTTPWNVTAAWSFVEALLASPSLSLLTPGDRHREVAALTFAEYPELRGNVLHDAHTSILMREHGIGTIYTRDRDFQGFTFLEVVNPVGE